ncbi:unnamed protein product [Linum tenue]|uniref:Uncharacterized protein n=1 Tax=Linum tenue TaxID=586396 RepID=A0AAV0K1S9_9ROSI|nr:unnamed protein product [Linum tenue]
MVLFDFKSDKHFVTSSDKTTLRVCELSDPSIHPSLIRNAHWREVGNITVDSDDDEERYYDGLLFFDGHGKIEGQEALTKLAQHLTRLGLMVSPGGCCFQDVTELREHKEFGIHYLRLNDLFNWSNHGVYSAKIGTWQRLELKYTVPKHKKISKSPPAGGVSKEKYEELRRTLNEKKEELKKVTTEMEDEIQKLRDDHEEELQKVQQEMELAIDKRDAELRKVKKEKGEELRNLRKEKDEEIRKLRREMHDEVERLEREKDEETSKQLDQKKDEEETIDHQPGKEQEMKMLRREANDLKKRAKEKDEELLKLRRELEDLRRSKKDVEEKEGDQNLEALQHVSMVGGAISKEKYEELKRMLKEKKEELKKVATEMEDEIQKLRDENDEELQKVQQEMEAAIDKRDAELRKVKKEKGEELRKLRKEKDGEIRKLRREMHDEAERLEREKDEEVAKLKEAEETTHEPTKEEELKMLRREANDSKKRENEKDEELLKLKRELEDLRRSKKEEEEEGHHRLEKEEEKKDKEALQQLIMEKDGKLQELGKLREQLLGKVEQYRKHSWSTLPSYTYSRDLVKLRKRVPRENFEKTSRLDSHDSNNQQGCHYYVPHIPTSSAFARRDVHVVDDASRDDWPAPPKIWFFVGNNGQFDADNWWFLKTTHPEGGTTMLGYYDGSLSICPDAGYSCNTRLPFPRGCDFCATRNFFLTCLDANEYRLAFTYRE